VNHKIENGTILKAAIRIAREHGFQKITRELIANKAGVSTGRVSQAFGTMIQLRRAIMRFAIKREELEIIAAGLGIQDKTAMKAPEHLKRKALELLMA